MTMWIKPRKITPGVFDSSDREEIIAYAAALKTNIINGRPYANPFRQFQTLAEAGQHEHERDARTIAEWHGFGFPSPYGCQVCLELEHRRAARVEAFRLAGLTLNETDAR